MAAADRAWLVLAAGVLGYDLLAPPSQTLSEGADRYMLSHPWLTRTVAFLVAAHVCNLVPARCDPIHVLVAGTRAWREARWTSVRSRRKSIPAYFSPAQGHPL